MGGGSVRNNHQPSRDNQAPGMPGASYFVAGFAISVPHSVQRPLVYHAFGRISGVSAMITTAQLKKKAQRGDPESQFRLGYRLAFGRHRARPTRWKEAFRLWHSVASLGHARAAFCVGCCYDDGKGVARHLASAAKWYRRAADAGHEEAMYNLALCYRNGEGVRRSARSAAQWLIKCSQLSYAPALRDLGVAYHEGCGLVRDDATAVELYRQAARQSDTMAMYNLGLCYVHGHGVTASRRLANHWFGKAAQLGHRAARTRLRLLRQA